MKERTIYPSQVPHCGYFDVVKITGISPVLKRETNPIGSHRISERSGHLNKVYGIVYSNDYGTQLYVRTHALTYPQSCIPIIKITNIKIKSKKRHRGTKLKLDFKWF